MSKETFDPTRYNHSSNEPFASVLEKYVSRRDVLKSGAAVAALSMFSAYTVSGCNSSSKDDNKSLSLNFKSIPGSKTDAVAVAEGYSAQVLAPWGTPLNSNAEEWKSDGTNTSWDQANAVGMHHDGMRFFPLNDSSTDGLLCINHEYIDKRALHPEGAERDAELVRKEINAHGMSVVRVKLTDGKWDVVKDDPHNRRLTAATEIDISGPVANTAALVTPFAPGGDKTRGTLNNCGNGFTPWGTYLTCEENWPGYFVADPATATEDQKRIGVPNLERGWYNWHDQAGSNDEVQGEFARFNLTPTGESALEDYRNEANGYGYIVEIDPYDPSSKAVKRTALGRFRHEGCAYGKLEAGKPITFYSGHDSRFEYLYKFVSNAKWDPADAERTDRLAVGAKYMDAGTLYVARFDEKGKGVWLPLDLTGPLKDGTGTLGDKFATEADIILNTAGAADLVGATPMDRPEWTAVDPNTGTIYLTLTNNTKRKDSTNPANPRLNNAFGHIIRWDEGTNNNFSWDIFVFGAPKGTTADLAINRSGLEVMNQFASPDGLVFDNRGIMWIQTDNGAEELTDYTNDQMLAVIPSQLRDANGNQEHIMKDNQAALRRFFVGPNGCEVTGLAFTPDHKNFFANIQHPGNWPHSSNAAEPTPEDKIIRPRAATVVITKDDNGEIGV